MSIPVIRSIGATHPVPERRFDDRGDGRPDHVASGVRPGRGAAGGRPAPQPAKQGSGAMFDHIAGRYDLLNRLLSMGIDRRWRRRTVEALELRPGSRIADVATGTADVALEIVRQSSGTTVIGLDPSPGMLEVGRAKVAAAAASDRIELRRGEAESLPLDDASVDGVTIAFGIRNVSDRGRALREMARVTCRDGRVAILELTEPERGLMAPLVRFHIHTLVPRLGAWLSGAREYRYLEESIAAFPSPVAFAQLMRDSGLEVLRVEPLTFGACHLFLGRPCGSPTDRAGEVGA